MTPKRPIEVVTASANCAEAWQKRDDMIDSGDTVGVQAMDLACDILDEKYRSLYAQWQILGGTSDIESIALFGGVRYQKPTTSTERARSISLDGGKLRPYSSFPRRRGVVVNLEDKKIHDWQWESWII